MAHRKDRIHMIMQEISYFADLGDGEIEFFDNLVGLMETFRDLNLIDYDTYDDIEEKLCQIWGFNH
jgi:hypothetical protein